MQVGEATLWSKDVQRLLWAAGEARSRAIQGQEKRPAARRQAEETLAPAADGGYFTEWQPATHAADYSTRTEVSS